MGRQGSVDIGQTDGLAFDYQTAIYIVALATLKLTSTFAPTVFDPFDLALLLTSGSLPEMRFQFEGHRKELLPCLYENRRLIVTLGHHNRQAKMPS